MGYEFTTAGTCQNGMPVWDTIRRRPPSWRPPPRRGFEGALLPAPGPSRALLGHGRTGFHLRVQARSIHWRQAAPWVGPRLGSGRASGRAAPGHVSPRAAWRGSHPQGPPPPPTESSPRAAAGLSGRPAGRCGPDHTRGPLHPLAVCSGPRRVRVHRDT
jgi:hypothetical protein